MALAAEERKVVSVLFADLVDSTARADRRDPEDVRAMLIPFYRLLRQELERFGGTVEKFIGDAVMALFGAPVAHEDDAERAVRAALGIREAIERLNGEQRLDLLVRTGIATGEALVALAARPGEGEGMASGDVVNTGFRLAAAAAPGAIVVDETTYRATRDAIEYRSSGQVEAKGKAEPIPIWLAEGVQAAAERRRTPPLVGREAELGELRAARERARTSGQPQLVTLVGGPGIGKSRLVRELCVESGTDIAWLQGRSLPYGEETPFWALAEILKTHAGILRTDGPEEAERKLRAALPAALAAEESGWVESHLRALVGLAQEAPSGREERFAAWRRLLEAIAADQPLTLVFEDLHWADEGLLEFVDYLVAWASGPLLVLCTARPELVERYPGWARAYAGATTISLGPLEERATIELVAESLGRTALPEHVEAALVGRVEGNPLYAKEYARMLLDRGLLREERSELPLPESVQAVIAARLDALPAEEKNIVQDAAVVGRACWVGVLAALGGLPRYEVGGRLEALERKEFLRREPSSSVAGEAQYSFHHVLVRDVAYTQIPRRARAEKHQSSAEWLEALKSSREDLAEMIAHHYQCALELADVAGLETTALQEQTRLALRAAGERALRLNAHTPARRYLEAALELTLEDDPQRPQLLFAYGKALAHGEQTGADVLREARDGFAAAGDLAAAVEVDVELSDLLRMQGSHDESFETLARARQLVADEPPSPSKAQVLSKLAAFLMFADRNEEAIATGFEAFLMADELDLPGVRSHALNNIGFARAALGDRGGIADLERSIAISLEINSPEALRGYINLGSLLANLGDLERAFAMYHEGEKLADRFGDMRGSLWFTAEAMYEAYWSGSWEEALALIEKLLREERALQVTRFDSRLVRGWIRLARGDAAGALDDAETVLEFARGGEAQFLLPALSFEARALLGVGREEKAAEAAMEALERWVSGAGTYSSFWLADVAVVVCGVGREHELLRATETVHSASKWVEAARAYADGRPAESAALYREIGSEPDAAYAGMRAAERALAAGDRSTAEAQLESAFAFYREVEAAAYAREARALLGASV